MLQTKFDQSSIVGEVVAEFPKSSDLFKKNRIDFCCGGNKPISEAAEARNVAVDTLLEELNTLYEESNKEPDQRDWRQASSEEIIKYIIKTHHAFLREELLMLAPYVKKVAAVHGGEHTFLPEVLSLFNELKEELLEHTNKEEAAAFPAILNFEASQSEAEEKELKDLIVDLEAEHDRGGDFLHQIRELTSDYQLPAGACRSFQLVYHRLEALEADTFLHIHLENNILFPRYS